MSETTSKKDWKVDFVKIWDVDTFPTYGDPYKTEVYKNMTYKEARKKVLNEIKKDPGGEDGVYNSFIIEEV